MSLGTLGHQVTPESGRAGPMGGRLSNWIDNGAQMTPHSSLHKRGIRRERARTIKQVNVQKSLLAKNGSVQIDVRVQLCLSEFGCRPQRGGVQERLQAWFGVAKNLNLLVVSVFAVRACQNDCTVSKT